MRGSKVLISIVGFKNACDIVNCLRYLSKSTHEDFVVSICENGGPAAYAALVEALREVAEPAIAAQCPPNPRILEASAFSLRPQRQPIHVFSASSNSGFAGGVNVTLEAFSDDETWSSVWLLNPDTLPGPEALRALVERQAETGADIVGSRLVFASTGKVQVYGGGRWRPLLARGRNIGLGSESDAKVNAAEIERHLDFVFGASLFASRDFIRKHGVMDEDFFLYYEEIEWCMRSENLKIAYAHESVVQHLHGSTIGSARKWAARPPLAVYLDERNRLLFSRNHYHEIYPFIVLAAFVMITRYLMHGSVRNFFVALHGWFDGVLGRAGKPSWLNQW